MMRKIAKRINRTIAAFIPESHWLVACGRSSDLHRFFRPSHLKQNQTVAIRERNILVLTAAGTVEEFHLCSLFILLLQTGTECIAKISQPKQETRKEI